MDKIWHVHVTLFTITILSLWIFIIINMFVPLDDGANLLNQKSLQALSTLAASENIDLQMSAAVYYLHLSHHRE